jgi:hypothetical protein
MLERPLPRAYVVGGLEILGNARGVVQALANVPFDPLELALADKGAVGDPASAARGLKPGRVRHEVKAMTYGPNSLRIDLWSEREGLLVVSDTWYPGWEARVNRQAARIMKVNGAFRGVRVPAGDSTVEMIFRPRSVRVGMWVSGGVLGALVLWLLWELIGPTARRAACG